MDAHIHAPRDDLSSPTTDSAIDMPMSTYPKAEPESESGPGPGPGPEPERDIPSRLATLAQRISVTNLGSHLHDPTVLECLDIIERAVSPNPDPDTDTDTDPRASFALEIAKYRPQSQSQSQFPSRNTTESTSRSFYRSGAPSPSTKTSVSEIQTQDGDRDQDRDQRQYQEQRQMQILLDNLTAQTTALLARRTESTQIYNLFTQRCETLETKVRGLQDEVRELKNNITESSIERETLRGTVLGLQDWITAWEKEYLHLHPDTSPDTDTGTGTGSSHDEALVEGISAWMRGWRDVDEGICLRERERERGLKSRQST